MTRPLALIVAVAANGVIGRDNALPWHLPEDLRWFKRMTMGKPVVMGRRTWDSIGRPLPGRVNLVVTGTPGWAAAGAVAAGSLAEACALAETLAPTAEETVVIGGARLFAEALGVARRFYLTEVGRAYDGDTWFPAYDRAAWREVSREAVAGDPPLSFVVLERAAG